MRSQAGRAFWLPPAGFRNDIDAAAWAPILETDRATALSLVRTLGVAAIPAFTAPIDPVRELTRHPGPWRIWVDSERYSWAESTLMYARETRSPSHASTAPSRRGRTRTGHVPRWLRHSGEVRRDA